MFYIFSLILFFNFTFKCKSQPNLADLSSVKVTNPEYLLSQPAKISIFFRLQFSLK